MKHLYSSLSLPMIKSRAEILVPMKSVTEFLLNSVVSIIEFFINIHQFSPSAVQQWQNSLCNSLHIQNMHTELSAEQALA